MLSCLLAELLLQQCTAPIHWPQLPCTPHLKLYSTVGSSILPPSLAHGCSMMTPRFGASVKARHAVVQVEAHTVS
jgi:hypothetical protein